MKKQNIDWDKVMNNAFIKPQLKWLQFLLSAREQNKKVIIFKRPIMNENIDLTKILKDCPEGWEFWSDNYGKVRFKCISKTNRYPIFVRRADGIPAYYTKEGWYNSDFPASCLLWPSKNQRDWNKFTASWYKKDKFNPKTLKPYNKVLVKNLLGKGCRWRCSYFSYYNKEADFFPYYCAGIPYSVCIPYNDETKHLVRTRKKAPEFYRYWED